VRLRRAAASLLLCAATGAFLMLSEWLFFATRSSFLDLLPAGARAAVAAVAASYAAALALLAAAGVLLLGAWLPQRARRLAEELALLPALCLLSAALLLLLDNFTYTLFGVGVVSTSGAWRLPHLLALVLFGIWSWRWLHEARAFLEERRGAPTAATVALGLSLAFAGLLALRPARATGAGIGAGYDVLLIAGDGIPSARTSLDGYARDTTPFLRSLAGEALWSRNHFSNAGNTGGAIVSLLTGKLPMTTHVVRHPDALVGRDAFEHLPGLLRQHGYRTLELGFPLYGSSVDLNLRDGFPAPADAPLGTLPGLAALAARWPSSAYFVEQVERRVGERVLHVFGVRRMPDLHAAVTGGSDAADAIDDDATLDRLIAFIDASREPYFAQVHLMGSHGPFFDVVEPHFSRGQRQDAEWLSDFLDDAIRDFDAHLQRVVAHLRATERMGHTILVVSSDHGPGWDASVRVPLVVLVPPELGATATIEANTQHVDVAPTVLEALGLEVPAWMEGRSLLRGDAGLDPLRPVYAGRYFRMEGSPLRGFGSLGLVSLVQCSRAHRLLLGVDQLASSAVAGHTAPCEAAELWGAQTVEAKIRALLATRGYDVDSIPATPLPFGVVPQPPRTPPEPAR